MQSSRRIQSRSSISFNICNVVNLWNWIMITVYFWRPCFSFMKQWGVPEAAWPAQEFIDLNEFYSISCDKTPIVALTQKWMLCIRLQDFKKNIRKAVSRSSSQTETEVQRKQPLWHGRSHELNSDPINCSVSWELASCSRLRSAHCHLSTFSWGNTTVWPHIRGRAGR